MSMSFQPLAHQPTSASEWVIKLAAFEDAINQKGLCAFVAKGFSDMSLEDKVILAGLLAKTRYEYKEYDPNVVYRNPEFFVRAFVNELFETLKFPMDKNNKKGFFELVVKAKTGDVNAALQIKGIFNNIPQPVIDALMPYYHTFICRIEQDCENLPEKVQLGRIAKAKEIFLKCISFAFVESKALELNAHEGFTPHLKVQLSKDFRLLRDSGVMDMLIEKLDAPRKNYKLPQIKEELKTYFDELVYARTKQYTQFHEHHQSIVKPLHEKVFNLHQFCLQSCKQFPLDSDMYKKLRHLGANIENAYHGVNSHLSKGTEVTPKDIENANQYIQELINQKINKITLLQLAVQVGEQDIVEQLMDAGADAFITTTEYQRGMLTKLHDVLIGFPSACIKNWRHALARNIIELAEISGQNDLAVLMVDKMEQKQTHKSEPHNEMTNIMDHELDDLLVDEPRLKTDKCTPIERKTVIKNLDHDDFDNDFKVKHDQHKNKL